jgi:threonine dehydrogenase-like Zn-dependent dehydrogenase
MVVKKHPKPEAGPGDAVVQVYATGICGSDLQMNVDKTQADENPAGHEVAGEIVEKEQTIVFSSCYNLLDGRHDDEVAIDLLASGTVPLQQIVTHIYALEDIQKGFETAYDKATGSIKVQIHQHEQHGPSYR